MKKRVWAAIVATALLLAGGLFAYRLIGSIETVRITDDLHMLRGVGGNVAVLRTGAGAVIVDSMLVKLQGRRIREHAEALTGEPVAVIVNTHYHADHTHGNPAFAPGTRVVATRRTREHLETRDARYWRGPAARLLPRETFDSQRELVLGDKTLRLIHPGRGHTDGDLVVLFVEDAALHTGDLVFHRHYPNIDLEAGGSVRQWGTTLGAVLSLPFEHVIPGHGTLTDREGVAQFRAFIEELAQAGREAVAAGKTLEETLASARLTQDAGYTEISVAGIGVGLDRDFVITRAWEDARAAADGRH